MSTWTVHCTQFEHMQRICITRLETLWQLLKFEIILSYNHKISNVNQYSLYDLWLKCCMTELFQLSQRTELHYHLSVWRQALQWVTKNSKISSYPHSGQSKHNSYNHSYTLSSNFVTKNWNTNYINIYSKNSMYTEEMKESLIEIKILVPPQTHSIYSSR